MSGVVLLEGAQWGSTLHLGSLGMLNAHTALAQGRKYHQECGEAVEQHGAQQQPGLHHMLGRLHSAQHCPCAFLSTVMSCT